MNRTIFLIGPMASGKSAVGAELARLLGSRVLDTDALVVQEHGPIQEIFTRSGEAAFRGFETEALRSAANTATQSASNTDSKADPKASPNAQAADGIPLVVATGGGAVLAPENRALISAGFAVYLFTDAQTVAQRIATDTGRPLLAAASTSTQPTSASSTGNLPTTAAPAATALEAWEKIFAQRAHLYEQCADVRIDTRTQNPVDIAEAIITAYRDA